MIMFDYLTTKGGKTPQKRLYNMEAAPNTANGLWRKVYATLYNFMMQK